MKPNAPDACCRAECVDVPASAREGNANAKRSAADEAYLRGVEWRRNNCLGEAVESYERAIALCPAHAPAHNNLGTLREQRGEAAAAASAYQKATEADPRFGLAWFNLGNCFRQENRLNEASACYRRALALMPADAETRINLATVLRELREFDESLDVLDEIPPASSEFPKARFNRSLVHLIRGALGSGWDEYEGRLEIEPNVRPILSGRWDGTPLGGGSILVLSEQGIGDQMMFASCLPDLLKQSANGFVECDARLVPLFARSFPQITAIPRTAGAGPVSVAGTCDVVEHIGSLPRFLRRRSEDFPNAAGYLRTNPELVAKWRSSLARLGGGLKVGISWQGGKDAETRRRRAIAIDLWEPIFNVPGVRFVNLQYGTAAADAALARRRFGVPLDDGTDCDPLWNLDDFAAKVAALDLVISVDNSTVHLAGAIGQPVWTLLPYAADWRWMLDRETTPWYPTMRLLRCRAADEWSELLRRAARRLTAAVFSRDLLHGAA